jgi:hypothetical protein
MRQIRFHAATLGKLFRDRIVVTMLDMKQTLGTKVDMTVFRKLREMAYLTSYSHGGRYYTLRDLAKFDERGLWSRGDIHFSRVGSLIDTVESFVVHSKTGYLASELTDLLDVEVKQPLLTLLHANRVSREKVEGTYLYTAPDPKRRRQQGLGRRATSMMEPFGTLPKEAATPDETKAAIILFLSLLDEQQRRLFAGLESLRLGRGGDRRIAQLTGMDIHTVGKGRRELQAHDIELERIRKPGGGRPPAEKKRRS